MQRASPSPSSSPPYKRFQRRRALKGRSDPSVSAPNDAFIADHDSTNTQLLQQGHHPFCICALCCIIVLTTVCIYFVVVDFGFHFSYNHLYSESELHSHLLPLPNAVYTKSNLEMKFTEQRYKDNNRITQFESFPKYGLDQTFIFETFIRHKAGYGIVYSVANKLNLVQTFVSISVITSQVIQTTPIEVGFDIIVENEYLFEQCNMLFVDMIADVDMDVECVPMDQHMIQFVKDNFYSNNEGGRRLWSSKWIVMIQSRFEHILFLDCDNIVIRDPHELFHSMYYRDHYQVVFWPDFTFGPSPWCRDKFYVHGPQHNNIWNIYNLSQRYDGEDLRWFYSQESGQILMNSKLYHNELLFALSNNDRNAVQSAVYGDKDFWRITFLLFNSSFLMMPYLPMNIGSITGWLRGKTHIGQFWFDHKLLFIHGNKLLNCYSFIQIAHDKSRSKLKYLCPERYQNDIAWIPTEFLRFITSFISGYRHSWLSDSHFYLNDESIRIELRRFEQNWREFYLWACWKMMEWSDDDEMEGLCQCQDPIPVYSLQQWAVMAMVFGITMYMLYRIGCIAQRKGVHASLSAFSSKAVAVFAELCPIQIFPGTANKKFF